MYILNNLKFNIYKPQNDFFTLSVPLLKQANRPNLKWHNFNQNQFTYGIILRALVHKLYLTCIITLL